MIFRNNPWKNQPSFAIYIGEPFAPKFHKEFNNLTKQWSEYMKNHSKLECPKAKDNLFDSTEVLKKDLQTFIIAHALSQHSTSENSISLLHSTAKKVFKDLNDIKFIKENGYYHELIIDCAFMSSLLLKKPPKSLSENCKFFKRSLTSNGLCHTFNGKKPSKLWRSSELTKIVEEKLMPDEDDIDFKFRGTGASEGI